MAYNYLTQYDSPNYTPASGVPAGWGRPRTIEAIAIHWWGDPNTNPTFEGVINTLCNPARQASAHFVATGTGRRVACLVDMPNASWATGPANPWTISIECDPRCRDEDYDVVAELISQIRDTYGDLPLVPHRQFMATQCPGNYDLGRLDALARTKVPHDEWGNVENKPIPEPPKPVEPPKPEPTPEPQPEPELPAPLPPVEIPEPEQPTDDKTPPVEPEVSPKENLLSTFIKKILELLLKLIGRK